MSQPALPPHNYHWRIWLLVIVLFFGFLYLIKSILLPFVVGILTAYFLDPAADKLEKWGASRALATTTITVGFFVTAALVFILIVPVVFGQLSGLLSSLPQYVEQWQAQYGPQLQEWVAHIGPEQFDAVKSSINNISGTLLGMVGNFLSGLLQSGFAVVNLLSLIFITPVVAFYLLKDWDRIIAKIDHLLPREFAPVVRQQIAEVDSTLAGFIRGQTNVCLFLATFYAIGLSLTGLKFGIIIGIITGFFAILPYVGIAFGLTLGISVAFFQFTDHYSVLYVLFVFMIGQFIEGNFITPRLVGEKVGLHPVWIIFGMLAGATLFGFVGILIAVPITAVIGVFVRFIIKQYLDSKLYHGAHPARMKALPPPAPASPPPATQGTPK